MFYKFNTFEKKDYIADAIKQLFTELYKLNITSFRLNNKVILE